LRDHSDLRAKVGQINASSVYSINLDLTALSLHDTTECKAEGGFTRTRSAYYSDFVSSLGFKTKVLEYQVSLRSVAEVNFIDGDGSCSWPVLGDGGFFGSHRMQFGLLDSLLKLQQFLDCDQVFFDLSSSVEQGTESFVDALKLGEHKSNHDGSYRSTHADAQDTSADEH